MLPPFTSDGLLPPGDFPLTFDELRASYLVTGVGIRSASWDTEWRAALVGNLESLAGQLWAVGIEHIFVGGSFVEDKDRPNDIDGYFECDEGYVSSGRLERDLNDLDPRRSWGWTTWTWDAVGRKHRLPMWLAYRVDLFPHYGQWANVLDQFGNPLAFPALVRRTRAHEPKGVVQIVR